jgi:FkbM family methyltransferase
VTFHLTDPIIRVLNFVGYGCTGLAWKMVNYQNFYHGEYYRWLKEDPHELQRITYPLSKTSLVVDIGGLIGDWASKIYCRYNCNIHIYEPCLSLAQQATENFFGNDKVKIYPFGMSNKTGKMILHGDWMEASLYRTSSTVVSEVDIYRASEIFNERYSKNVDLVKINVEGAEYDILPDLIKNYDMNFIKNLQIQFHPNIKAYKEKRDKIRNDLKKTHRCTWCYDFVYESWEVVK